MNVGRVRRAGLEESVVRLLVAVLVVAFAAVACGHDTGPTGADSGGVRAVAPSAAADPVVAPTAPPLAPRFVLRPGDHGPQVRQLQARLIQIDWLFGDVSGTYDAATTEALRGFQAKRGIPVTGAVDQATLDRLVAMTRTPTYEELHNIRPEPGALDPRCTTGRALCVDKSTNSLRWVVDGQVLATFDVRFGSSELPTREGGFTVHYMSRDHVSQLYDTSMPFAMFFSGGQAIHYSPDFAANGYNGASHGCVNVRDYDGMVWLFDQVRVGDKVVVYWS